MAIKVTRSMLQHKYSWKAVGGDDPKAIKIDAYLLNRHEGYEVVPMIQKVVNHFDYGSESDVQKVEEIIGSELPGNVRGRENVYDWLVDRLGEGGGEGAEAAPQEAAAGAEAPEAELSVPKQFYLDMVKKLVGCYEAGHDIEGKFTSFGECWEFDSDNPTIKLGRWFDYEEALEGPPAGYYSSSFSFDNKDGKSLSYGFRFNNTTESLEGSVNSLT